jgi:3-(3-hydroxy-phenyl)propionate hydroxylase
VLLHKQADNVWRMDFQLGWDADPDAEKKPERITPRVQEVLRQGFGREVPFSWNGPASTPSPACAWTASATAA